MILHVLGVAAIIIATLAFLVALIGVPTLLVKWIWTGHL